MRPGRPLARLRGWTAVVMAVLRRPSLWSVAVRQVRRLAPDRWWRRAPFLPVPTREYRDFRMVTQYGSVDHPPAVDDVLNYLAWCRRMAA